MAAGRRGSTGASAPTASSRCATLVVPTSVYLESGHFQDGRLADASAASALTDLVRALVAMTGHARDQAGPPPLAAGRG